LLYRMRQCSQERCGLEVIECSLFLAVPEKLGGLFKVINGEVCWLEQVKAGIGSS